MVAYLQNQEGFHSRSLFLLAEKVILVNEVLFCNNLHVVLSVPGKQKLIVDSLSRSLVPVNTELELNHKLETYVPPIPDQNTLTADSMTMS